MNKYLKSIIIAYMLASISVESTVLGPYGRGDMIPFNIPCLNPTGIEGSQGAGDLNKIVLICGNGSRTPDIGGATRVNPETVLMVARLTFFSGTVL